MRLNSRRLVNLANNAAVVAHCTGGFAGACTIVQADIKRHTTQTDINVFIDIYAFGTQECGNVRKTGHLGGIDGCIYISWHENFPNS